MKDADLKTMDAIRNLALTDLDEVSDEELLAEFVADGLDAEILAREVADKLDSVVAATLRAQSAQAKDAFATRPLSSRLRPSLDRMKSLIDQAFAGNSSLAAAYRQGTRMSDADLSSLYDDLLELGKIDPQDNDD